MLPEKNRRKVRAFNPDALYARRVELRLKVAELAAKSGVTAPTIYRLESGRVASARMTTLRSLADALDVNVETLLLDDERDDERDHAVHDAHRREVVAA